MFTNLLDGLEGLDLRRVSALLVGHLARRLHQVLGQILAGGGGALEVSLQLAVLQGLHLLCLCLCLGYLLLSRIL